MTAEPSTKGEPESLNSMNSTSKPSALPNTVISGNVTDSETMPPPPPGYPVPAKSTVARPAGVRPVTAVSSTNPTNLRAKRPVTTIASARPYQTSALANTMTTTNIPSNNVAPPPPVQVTSPNPPQHHQTKYIFKPSKQPTLLRRGKWTPEEEEYATRLINLFKSGLLPLTDGTTLRNFLSKLLNCDPMRISKKFVGNNCIGKQVFRRKVSEVERLTEVECRKNALELSELEQRFFDRVATTNRIRPQQTPQLYGAPGHHPRGYMDEEPNRPPTPPWLKPPENYVSKRASRKKMRMMPVYQPPLPSTATTQPAGTKVPIVTIAKSTVTDGITKSNNFKPEIKKSESALEQLARTASAAKFVEDIVNGDSGLGDLEIKGSKLSSLSLQGSFQAIMSLDMDSVENLAQLTSSNLSCEELNRLAESQKRGSGFKSSSRMESFVKSLSNANMKGSIPNFLQKSSTQDFTDDFMNDISSSGLSKLLESTTGLSKLVESSTGLSKLRAINGLNPGVHSSVEDFLSLMATGDLPHEDTAMLNAPLKKVIGSSDSSSKMSQHQLLKLASRASLAKLASKDTLLSESLSDLADVCSSVQQSNGSLKKRKRGDDAS